MTLRSMHHPISRAALNLPGLCPVCGGSASRKITCDGGMARETYRCAVDGEIEYAHGAEVGIRLGGQDVSSFPRRGIEGFEPLAALAAV